MVEANWKTSDFAVMVLVVKLRPKSKAKKRCAKDPWHNDEKAEQEEPPGQVQKIKAEPQEWMEQLDVEIPSSFDWKRLFP